jgi:hypothetical protein
MKAKIYKKIMKVNEFIIYYCEISLALLNSENFSEWTKVNKIQQIFNIVSKLFWQNLAKIFWTFTDLDKKL